MPTGITIQNADNVQHFYTASDLNNANNLVFQGNVDPGANSTPFDLAAGADGLGQVNVQPAGLIGQGFFGVADNRVLIMN
jgi:hypothetical protein